MFSLSTLSLFFRFLSSAPLNQTVHPSLRRNRQAPHQPLHSFSNPLRPGVLHSSSSLSPHGYPGFHRLYGSCGDPNTSTSAPTCLEALIRVTPPSGPVRRRVLVVPTQLTFVLLFLPLPCPLYLSTRGGPLTRTVPSAPLTTRRHLVLQCTTAHRVTSEPNPARRADHHSQWFVYSGWAHNVDIFLRDESVLLRLVYTLEVREENVLWILGGYCDSVD